jgi:hypothetical protein
VTCRSIATGAGKGQSSTFKRAMGDLDALKQAFAAVAASSRAVQNDVPTENDT